MKYLDSEEKTELKLKIFRNQKLHIVFVFLYLIGIIIQVTALVVTPKGILNLVTLMIAPICTIGWIYFTSKLYDFRASAYNRFGSEGIYHNLTIFWGNKKLPIAALFLSLFLAISSFFNFFVLGKQVRKIKTNIAIETNETYKHLKAMQQLVNELGNQNFNVNQQQDLQMAELQKLQEGLQKQVYNISTQLDKINSANNWTLD